MLCINSTPALTILYSMLLLYPSSSYSLFEIKDFPCNCLSRVLRKCLISMSVIWMCMNMIDPSISLTGVMLDLWPHWQQEIRGRTHAGSSELLWMGCSPHAPYDMCILHHRGPNLFSPSAFRISGLRGTQSCTAMKTEPFSVETVSVTVSQRCHRILVDLAGVKGTQGPCYW